LEIFAHAGALGLASARFPEEKCGSAFENEREGKIQMRLSQPLLFASFGVLFVAACTLITDVDRSKIPDGVAGAPSAGDSTQPTGGAPDMNMAGQPNVSGKGGGGSSSGGTGGTGGSTSTAGAAGEAAAGNGGAAMGGAPAADAGAAGMTAVPTAGAGGAP
jgi:hypothetical protein